MTKEKEENFAICIVVKVSMLIGCKCGFIDYFEAFPLHCMVAWSKDLVTEVAAKFAISTVLVLDFCVM